MIPVDMEQAMRQLTLMSPLPYVEAPGLDPFARPSGGGERLFCFETGDQAGGIDAEEDRFLGPLLFSARAGTAGRGEKPRELPRGAYLFAQFREIPEKSGIIRLAVELHKEGLWQRFVMEPRFFLRYLFEDRREVIQILRPLQGQGDRRGPA
jgi:hypothetical protein